MLRMQLALIALLVSCVAVLGCGDVFIDKIIVDGPVFGDDCYDDYDACADPGSGVGYIEVDCAIPQTNVGDADNPSISNTEEGTEDE